MTSATILSSDLGRSRAAKIGVDLARLLVAGIAFLLASASAIPPFVSLLPAEFPVTSATVVTALVMLGVIAIPSRGWARWVGLGGFAIALWLTIWVIGASVLGGFWEGATWLPNSIP